MNGIANVVESANKRSGMIPWVTYSRTSANRDHNSKAFDLHFIPSRAVLLKWRPELVMSGQKIILMKMEHIKFIDSMFSALPTPQIVRNIWSDLSEMVVPSLFQYTGKPAMV